jgi:hypothetical protein
MAATAAMVVQAMCRSTALRFHVALVAARTASGTATAAAIAGIRASQTAMVAIGPQGP